MRLGVFALALAPAVLAAAAPAQAEWLRAKSRHFIIYSDTRQGELRELATKLERFDGAVRYLYSLPDDDEFAANPLTIYVAQSQSAVERLCGCPNVAGFYEARVTGAVAFTPRRNSGEGAGALNAQTVLFHEYGHHLMLAAGPAASPAWYSEGVAELIATALVKPEAVEIGHAANHRAQGLFDNYRLPLVTLFAPPPKMSLRQIDQLYGWGWLLTHYVTFNQDRRAQMQAYLRAFAAGTPPLDAAKQAFGDLKQLDRELDKYLRSRMYGYSVPVAKLRDVRIDVRPLTAGERALIDLRMVSTRGVDVKTGAALYARAAKAAVPADDAVAQGWLAEMAFDAVQDAAAEVAADRALAADPKSVHALLYKARVHLRRAAMSKTADAKVWAEARSWIVKANRLENNHAGALALYHQSFAMAGQEPSEAAVNGLHYAMMLVPQDRGLRFQVAIQDLRNGKVADARRTLMPLAYAPHAGPDNPAARLLALIDGGKTGEAALLALAEQDAARAKAAEKD